MTLATTIEETGGYVLAFPASSGRTAYLCDPNIFGEHRTSRDPWMRAEHKATLFATVFDALDACKQLRKAQAYVAPELNNRLDHRLGLANILHRSVVDPNVNLVGG